jgi:hypothetical protein
VAWKLTEAVKWRAQARDALCGVLNLRGPAPPNVLEALVADSLPIGVELAEVPLLASIARDARKWQGSADELLRRCIASAATATAAELLHFEDAAGAGPEAEYVSVAGRVTLSMSDVRPASEDAAAAAAADTLKASAGSSGAASRPAAATIGTRKRARSGSVTGGGDEDDEEEGDDAGVGSAEAATQQQSSRRRTTGAAQGRARGGPALAYSSRFNALLAAAESDPPVPLDDLRAVLRDSLAIPAGLNPQLADLQSRAKRCVELATAVLQHLPHASSPNHSARPCGSRLAQVCLAQFSLAALLSPRYLRPYPPVSSP